jgi:hypothetical protein
LAGKQNGITMEVFLARLPWLMALMMRNTFFPMWDLIVDKLFGTIAGPLGQAMSPVKSMLGEAKGVASKVKDIKDRASKAKDQLAKGVDEKNVGTFIKDLTGGPPSASKAPDDDPATFWPWDQPKTKDQYNKREQPGEGLAVTLSEIEAAEKQTTQLKFA